MCHRKRVEETKVPEMALDYLDNTLSRSEKAHDSYYRALQKSNQSAKETKLKNPQKSNKKPAIPLSEQISCWAWIRQWQSKQKHTNQVLEEHPYTMILPPL